MNNSSNNSNNLFYNYNKSAPRPVSCNTNNRNDDHQLGSPQNSYPSNNNNSGDNTYYNKKNAPKQLNPNNQLLSRKFIKKLFKKFGIKGEPRNMDHYQRAFVHKSYVKSDSSSEEDDDNEINNNSDDNGDISNLSNSGDGTSDNTDDQDLIPFQEHSYERLEYMGDAVLNKIAAYYVFSRYPNQEEGFLTTLRTKLVRSQTLAKLAAKLKLNKYILISKYVEEKCNGRNNPKILEDIFESLIGAIYLDFGPEPGGLGDQVCMTYVINILESYIDITRMIRREDNYKRVLLEYYQPRFRTEPKYQIISMRGPTSSRTYTMGALSPTGEIIGIGTDRKKREAENIASKNALIYYGVEVEESDEEESTSSEEETSSEESTSSEEETEDEGETNEDDEKLK